LTNIAVAADNPAYSSLNGVLFDKSQTTLIQFPDGYAGNYDIPDSVTSIGDFAFVDCFSLTNITVAADNPTYSSLNGVLFDKNQTTLIQYPIGSVATGYVIPNNVTSIGGYAFYDCTNLTSVTFPDSITSIGDFAFEYCTSLTNLTFLGNAPALGTFPVFDNVPGKVYYHAGTSGWSAFYGGLPTVELGAPPAQVNYAVAGATAYVTNSPNVSGNITIVSTYEGYPVTSIGNDAFNNCANLMSVTIPDSVTNLGDSAFFNCTSLMNVIIPNSVTSIGGSAFADCISLTSVTIPDSITSIGLGAFQFSGLTSVTIPDSVTNLGDFAFSFCTSLKNAVIGNGITSIGLNEFAYCNSLTSVTISDSITSIGNAFDLSGLTSVTIPDSVTNITDYAFSYCTSLTNITFLGNAPALGSNVFESVLGTVYYYAGMSGWSAFYGGLPTVELFGPPQIGKNGVNSGNVGVQSGGFGFSITGVANQTVVIEASTNLINWQPIWTNILSGTSTNFTDSQWTNYPSRYYRAR
jgi:BspA type Leucine rich repeat region (6 copies)